MEEEKSKRPYTEARKNSNRAWDSKNLDRISVALPKGKRNIVKVHAEERGESLNAFVNRAIDTTMELDNRREDTPPTDNDKERGIYYGK